MALEIIHIGVSKVEFARETIGAGEESTRIPIHFFIPPNKKN